MNFTYLQHPSTCSFHGEIHLLLTTHFHSTLQEMSLLARKKMSHANVTFSRILCSCGFLDFRTVPSRASPSVFYIHY
jgi:hypothetical protein